MVTDKRNRTIFSCFISFSDVWKVCTKTGVYKPEDEEEDEEDEDDDEGNTNNNANNEEELRKQKDLERRRKERRRKFHLPPHPPTGQLIVVVYGNRGKTGELPLNPVNPKAEDMFTPGHEDEFKVCMPKFKDHVHFYECIIIISV